MDVEYTKREIDSHFENLVHLIKDIDGKVSANNALVKETNGKVANIQIWREQVNGAAKATGVLCMLVVIPLLTWAFLTIARLDERINEKVKDGIKDALLDYEVQIK